MFGLAELMLIGLFLAGGIALAAFLLANRRTRPVGIALLVGAAGVVMLGVLGLYLAVGRSTSVSPVPPEPATAQAPVLRPVSTEPSTAQTPVPRPARKASGVLPAMTNSLAKAAAETGVGRATKSVREAPSVLAASVRALAKALSDERKRPGRGALDVVKRPAWLDAEPGVVDDVYQMTAMVGPFATRQECDDAQPEALREVAADYIQKYLGPGAPRSVRLSPEFLQGHVVADVWEDQRMTDFGPGVGQNPMIQRYVLLKFGREVNDELKQQQRTAIIHRRLRAIGTGMAGILAALALVFAGLKIKLASGSRQPAAGSG